MVAPQKARTELSEFLPFLYRPFLVPKEETQARNFSADPQDPRILSAP